MPAEFPPPLILHEPEHTQCQCGCTFKRICDDVSEKLDYKHGVLSVERQVGAKRVCDNCAPLFRRWCRHRSSTKVPRPTARWLRCEYEIEREARDLEPDVRQRIRQEKAAPDEFQARMIAQRKLVQEGLGITKALDYSLKRWTALSRYLNDGKEPVDNNHIENQIRPSALRRTNWLVGGSLRSGQRAEALMNFIQLARYNRPSSGSKSPTNSPTNPNVDTPTKRWRNGKIASNVLA